MRGFWRFWEGRRNRDTGTGIVRGGGDWVKNGVWVTDGMHRDRVGEGCIRNGTHWDITLIIGIGIRDGIVGYIGSWHWAKARCFCFVTRLIRC